MRPRWRRTRRCARSCGGTRARVTRSFCGGWRRRRASRHRRARTWRGWIASAGSARQTGRGRVRRVWGGGNGGEGRRREKGGGRGGGGGGAGLKKGRGAPPPRPKKPPPAVDLHK